MEKIINLILIVLIAAVIFILISRFFKLTWAVMDLPSIGWGNRISIADLGRAWRTAAERRAEVSIGGGRWRTEIAADNWSRAQGLSGRKNLPADEGMLFIFSEAARHSFWMKGMNFPLDLIWIGDGRVVDITANAPPLSLTQGTVIASESSVIASRGEAISSVIARAKPEAISVTDEKIATVAAGDLAMTTPPSLRAAAKQSLSSLRALSGAKQSLSSLRALSGAKQSPAIFYKPKQPANMVLEINAGEAAKFQIKVGDAVVIKK